MSANGSDAHEDELLAVKLPSGGSFKVYTRERPYFQDRVKRYLSDNSFTNVADLQTLDLIIQMELFCFRWTSWLSEQTDYWGDPIDERDVAKQIKETSTELRALKSALGIDKVTRDKVRGEDSVPKYLENLLLRAKEFGVMREDQLGKALELFNEIIAAVTLYDNTDAEERLELKCGIDDLVNWLRDDCIPRFTVIDEHFRKNKQRFWIRDQ